MTKINLKEGWGRRKSTNWGNVREKPQKKQYAKMSIKSTKIDMTQENGEYIENSQQKRLDLK